MSTGLDCKLHHFRASGGDAELRSDVDFVDGRHVRGQRATSRRLSINRIASDADTCHGQKKQKRERERERGGGGV